MVSIVQYPFYPIRTFWQDKKKSCLPKSRGSSQLLCQDFIFSGKEFLRLHKLLLFHLYSPAIHTSLWWWRGDFCCPCRYDSAALPSGTYPMSESFEICLVRTHNFQVNAGFCLDVRYSVTLSFEEDSADRGKVSNLDGKLR